MAIMEQVIKSVPDFAVPDKFADTFSALKSAGIWPKEVGDEAKDDDAILFLQVVPNKLSIKKFRNLRAKSTLQVRYPLSLNKNVYFILSSKNEGKIPQINQALIDFGVVGEIMVSAIQDVKEEVLQRSDIIIIDSVVPESLRIEIEKKVQSQKPVYSCLTKKVTDYRPIFFNLFRSNYVASKSGNTLIKVGQTNMTADQIKDNIIDALNFVGLFLKDWTAIKKFVGLKTQASETVPLFEITDDTVEGPGQMSELHAWRSGLKVALDNARLAEKRARLEAETPKLKAKRLAKQAARKEWKNRYGKTCPKLQAAFDAFKKADKFAKKASMKAKKAAKAKLEKDTTEKQQVLQTTGNLELKEAYKLKFIAKKNLEKAKRAVEKRNGALEKREKLSPEEKEAAKLKLETPLQKQKRVWLEWRKAIWEKMSQEQKETCIIKGIARREVRKEEREMRLAKWETMTPEEKDAATAEETAMKLCRRLAKKAGKAQIARAAKKAAGETLELEAPSEIERRQISQEQREALKKAKIDFHKAVRAKVEAMQQEKWEKMSPEEKEAEKERKEKENKIIAANIESRNLRRKLEEQKRKKKKVTGQQQENGTNAGSPNLKQNLEVQPNEQGSAVPKKKKKKKKKKNKKMTKKQQQGNVTNASSPNLKRKLEDGDEPNLQGVLPIKKLKPMAEKAEQPQAKPTKALRKKKNKNVKTQRGNVSNIASLKLKQTSVNGSAANGKDVGSPKPKQSKRRKSKGSAQSLSSNVVNLTPTSVNGSAPKGSALSPPSNVVNATPTLMNGSAPKSKDAGPRLSRRERAIQRLRQATTSDNVAQ